MAPAPVRYTSPDEDSDRWRALSFRPGDIVISTRSKSGTTWMQMICALLVFGRPELPEPLGRLSPWLDWMIEPSESVVQRLDAQRHRRFIKTHTPLDGVPIDDRVFYVVVARHPLDAAVSLYHQRSNIDRDRMADLLGEPRPAAATRSGDAPLDSWLRAWVDDDTAAAERLDGVRGFLHHLGDAWARRAEPNVVLVHYADLLADLDGEMRRLGTALGFPPPSPRWPELVAAARFEAMAGRADELAPTPPGVLHDPQRFFRQGGNGDGARALDDEALARYHRRAGELAPPELLAWLHRP